MYVGLEVTDLSSLFNGKITSSLRFLIGYDNNFDAKNKAKTVTRTLFSPQNSFFRTLRSCTTQKMTACVNFLGFNGDIWTFLNPKPLRNSVGFLKKGRFFSIYKDGFGSEFTVF